MHDKKIEDASRHEGALAEEKRRSPRYSLDIAVKVAVVNDAGLTSVHFGRGSDISEGGMAIFLAYELSIGTTIRLTLTLPHTEKPIACQAVVRSRISYRYGVEFTDLSTIDREILIRTCRSLSLLQ